MASQHQRNIGPMQAAARCGARTRAGGACQAPMTAGGKRCRMHGGKGSGAPRNNRNAFKTGLHTAKMQERKREVRIVAQRVAILAATIAADARQAKLAKSLGLKVSGASKAASATAQPENFKSPEPVASASPSRARAATSEVGLPAESDRPASAACIPISHAPAPTIPLAKVFLGSFGKSLGRAILLTRQDM